MRPPRSSYNFRYPLGTDGMNDEWLRAVGEVG